MCEVEENKPTTLTDNFSTSDMNLSAFLLCNHVSMIGHSKENGTRVTFIFEGGPDTDTLVTTYYNDGRVHAREYASTLRDLKGLIAST